MHYYLTNFSTRSLSSCCSMLIERTTVLLIVAKGIVNSILHVGKNDSGIKSKDESSNRHLSFKHYYI